MARFFSFFVLLSPLLADQITLNNGDRLTGMIVRASPANLVIDTGSAGTVTIAWGSIQAISSDAPLFVALSDGRTLLGAVSTAGAQLRIATQDQGVVTVARDLVAAIRNQSEQAQYERMLAPGLLDLWTGFLDLGLAASRGNANTSTFTLSANASRTTNTDKLGAYFTSIYSSSDVSGERQTTANSKRGGVSYNRRADSRLFYFGSLDLEADEFQNLDLRVVPAGGGGYHAIRRDSTTLDFRFGVSGNLEYFSTGLERKSTEALFGQELVYRFTADTSLNQRFAYFGNLSNTGAHRINFDTTFATRLNRWLALQFTVSDRYLSNPVPGRKTNDILFSTGVRLSLGS